MSPQKSNEPALVPAGVRRKSRPDLYTVLLAIALVAVLMGIVFLYLEMKLYEFKIDGGPMVSMASSWPVASFCRVGIAHQTVTFSMVGGAHPT